MRTYQTQQNLRGTKGLDKGRWRGNHPGRAVVGFVLLVLVSGCSEEQPAEEAPAGEESVGEQGGSGEAVVVEGFAVPDKVPLKSPPLGTALDDLVSALEAGDLSEEEAAAAAPVSRGRSVGVTVHVDGNVDGVLFVEPIVSPEPEAGFTGSSQKE